MLVAAPQRGRGVIERDAADLVAVGLDAAPADAVAVKVDVADRDHARVIPGPPDTQDQPNRAAIASMSTSRSPTAGSRR